MQIGTRWRVGTPPPAGMPEPFLTALDDAAVGDGVWTITWLEGRPVGEHESGLRLALGPDGVVRDDTDDEDDDWLS